MELQQQVKNFSTLFRRIQSEMGKVIVGNEDITQLCLASIFANGHVLLEGAPGLGKTLLVKTLAQLLGLSFNRIQFTSDLMPSDITGTQVLTEDASGRRSFTFRPGPLFA